MPRTETRVIVDDFELLYDPKGLMWEDSEVDRKTGFCNLWT